jgi:hypothetical protein
MSAKSETIRVRISPGVRTWQALLVAVALVASMLLGLVLGRASAPDATANVPGANAAAIEARDLSQFVCTGHVPSVACELKHARAVGNTAHVPPEGYGR